MSKTIYEHLKDGKSVIVSPKGRSMFPLILEGKTKVMIVPVDRELEINEITIFLQNDGTYCLHRIIDKDEINYYTRGDNNTFIETIAKENALGVVAEIYRNDKTITMNDNSYKLYVNILKCLFPVKMNYRKLKGDIKRGFKSVIGNGGKRR